LRLSETLRAEAPLNANMNVIGFASTPDEIVALLARRRYELGMTSRAVETVAGLADGYVSKIECGTKSLGRVSLPTLLAAYGLRLAVVEDEAGLPARTRAFIGTARPSSHARQRNPAPPTPEPDAQAA